MASRRGTFHIEAGAIAAMRRSFGVEAIYDEEALAPLTFTQASAHEDPASHLRPHSGVPWKGSGKSVSGVDANERDGEGWMHAEQHFEYHRHLRAGDVVTWETTAGRAWSKEGSTSVLSFQEEITEFRANSGELVVTARIIRVRRLPTRTTEESS